MKYTKEAFIRAESVIAERRSRSKEEYQSRLEQIRQRAPEIYALHSKLNVANCGLVSVIGSGMSREEIDKRIAGIRQDIAQRRQAIRAGLRAMGLPEDYLAQHFYCPNCQDQGYKEGVMCSCFESLLRRFTTEELNSKCSIQLHDFSEFRPELYPDTLLNGASVRDRMIKVCESCQIYARRFSADSHSLLFYGGTGLGKTFISSCIAKYLLENGVNVLFGSFTKLLRQIEDERFNRSEGDTVGMIIDSELAILDDVGSEFKNTFTESVLYEIINERINLGRPTIVSTNLSLKELKDKYNDRIVSRLTGCFMSFKFLGTDIRQKLRIENAGAKE